MRFSGTKLYRKIRYRKGFGVHSPFVYNLITKVIEEKSPYYIFEEIEQFRANLLSRKDYYSKITAKEAQPSNYGAFLFRLMNFLKCQSVVQVGCSTGVISLYLVMASGGKTSCYLLEERPGLLQFVRYFSMAQNFNNVQILEGDYKENSKRIVAENERVDFILMNNLPKTMKAEEGMLLCKALAGKNSIIILNDIIKNKEIKKLWIKLKEDTHTRMSVDLYRVGLIFFNEKLPKKHYKGYFSYGKKQNIYKKRRRRLYFTGWRKESTQNQYSD
ncbi:MAG: class I SAM-dependent methyltransferase [Bacteroidales bacterium]|nr:class I SAM-dependent methyltransferase [Bacteroidales bacterium]